MEETQQQFMDRDMATKFIKSFWPEWNSAIYSELYRTYHPSYTNETLSSPSAMFIDATQTVRDAVAEGRKLGLLHFVDSHFTYSIGCATCNGQLALNWVEATLLYRVLEYIIDEFRHYCGENGIDPSGTGKCLDDFPHLREDYLGLRDRILYFKNEMRLPVETLLEPGQLDLIPLASPITTESVMKTLMENNPKWWKDVGSKLLKENKEEKNNIRKKILEETTKLMITKIPLMEEKPRINPQLEEGDVIELIYMDDPWSPIPPLTRGVVMGFEKVPGGEPKILVSWIIEDDKNNESLPVFRNLPMIPEVDVWRKVNVPPQIDEQQEINYKNVSNPKKYGDREYVYFKGTDSPKESDSEKIILSGPNGDITLNAIEVKNAKFGGLQVNYNNDTRDELDRLFSYVDLTQDCNFADKELKHSNWSRGTQYLNKTWRKVDGILRDLYSSNIAGPNEPTPDHIPNGFINIPGTDAPDTTHGWSILNFFNTNPSVRRILVKEYEEYVKENNKPCRFIIEEFTDWLGENKYDIFGLNSPLFNKLVKANQSSWSNGLRNEKAVVNPLQEFYGEDWSVIYKPEPGILKDALKGIDMSVVNNNTGEKHTYQAKQLGHVEEVDGKWIVHSGWLHRYDPKQVTHFVFGPTPDGGAVVFKNNGESPGNDRTTYTFNSPPLF